MRCDRCRKERQATITTAFTVTNGTRTCPRRTQSLERLEVRRMRSQ
jgi:hypothetical protein